MVEMMLTTFWSEEAYVRVVYHAMGGPLTSRIQVGLSREAIYIPKNASWEGKDSSLDQRLAVNK